MRNRAEAEESSVYYRPTTVNITFHPYTTENFVGVSHLTDEDTEAQSV
jgi:hypothetical protein